MESFKNPFSKELPSAPNAINKKLSQIVFKNTVNLSTDFNKVKYSNSTDPIAQLEYDSKIVNPSSVSAHKNSIMPATGIKPEIKSLPYIKANQASLPDVTSLLGLNTSKVGEFLGIQNPDAPRLSDKTSSIIAKIMDSNLTLDEKISVFSTLVSNRWQSCVVDSNGLMNSDGSQNSCLHNEKSKELLKFAINLLKNSNNIPENDLDFKSYSKLMPKAQCSELGRLMNQLGDIYLDEGNVNKAHSLYKNAFDMDEAAKDNNFGCDMKQMLHFDKSTEFLNKARSYYKSELSSSFNEINPVGYRQNTYYHLVKIDNELGYLNEAQLYLNKIKKFNKEYGNDPIG